MVSDKSKAEAEQLAMRLLAKSTTWVCPTALAAEHQVNWRPLARALRRLEGKGIISGRQVEFERAKGRKSLRREYRLQVNTPLLVMLPKFDPSQLNIVGVRVVRFD